MAASEPKSESSTPGSDPGSTAWTLLSRLRRESPLIQCITNFVSMDLMANALLAAGASPAMVHSLPEIPDFTPLARALCVNVGTLTPDWLPAMKAAAEVAGRLGTPWVLDPAAAAASEFRLKACLELLELKPSVVRGNASEIMALCSACRGESKGADSLHESTEALEVAKSLAKRIGAIVVVSGAVDIVTDGERVVCTHNGIQMMQRITATGCAVTALIAAFVAIEPSNALQATASALAVFGLAGDVGMEQAKGPASLRVHLVDALYQLDEPTVRGRIKVTNLDEAR